MLWQIIKKSLSLLNRDNNNVTSHTSNQLIQRAIEHHQAGYLKEAEAVYQNILREQPDNPDALHLLGLVAHQVGNNEFAVNLIEKAISIEPNVPDFYFHCGEAYRALYKNDLAITHYQQALAIKPDYAEILNNLGQGPIFLDRKLYSAFCHDVFDLENKARAVESVKLLSEGYGTCTTDD